jgi:hypothetical protein
MRRQASRLDWQLPLANPLGAPHSRSAHETNARRKSICRGRASGDGCLSVKYEKLGDRRTTRTRSRRIELVDVTGNAAVGKIVLDYPGRHRFELTYLRGVPEPDDEPALCGSAETIGT